MSRRPGPRKQYGRRPHFIPNNIGGSLAPAPAAEEKRGYNPVNLKVGTCQREDPAFFWADTPPKTAFLLENAGLVVATAVLDTRQ